MGRQHKPVIHEPRVLVSSHLPPPGARVPITAVIERTGLPMVQAYGALIALCCDGLAMAENNRVERGRPRQQKRAR
jgi:hypothetical protein